MTQAATLWDKRITRLSAAVGPVDVLNRPQSSSVSPIVAVTSSRLGHDTSLHRHVCRFLCRTMIDCRTRGGALLIASGSAIEPWAVRAAELFAVPVMRVCVVAEKQSTADTTEEESFEIVVRSDEGSKLSRDAVLIALADRVDAVYVRRGGTIEGCLRERITRCNDASTRVALSLHPKCAATGLIADGAIGWFLSRADEPTAPHVTPTDEETRCDVQWTRTDGQWLVHCTRGRDGAWPGETERQYRDAILLGDESAVPRGPLDALVRIIRSGRIVAAATATKQKHPVVCFSAMSLEELLQRRCFRPQLGRWDYEPFGVAIRVKTAKQIGIEPVIYGDPNERAALASKDQYRFHPVGKTYDWRAEREWRSRESVDLAQLAHDDVCIFAEDTSDARARLKNCPWQVTFVAPDSASGQAADKREAKGV